MSWAAHSCPDVADQAAQPPVRSRGTIRFEHKPQERPPALELSLKRMCEEGFYQCCFCFKISHEYRESCPRCYRRPMKFIHPVL